MVNGTSCQLAEFDGSGWTAIRLANSIPVSGSIDAIQGPLEAWQPRRLLAYPRSGVRYLASD